MWFRLPQHFSTHWFRPASLLWVLILSLVIPPWLSEAAISHSGAWGLSEIIAAEEKAPAPVPADLQDTYFPELTDQTLDRVLQDRENRISKEFSVPKSIEKNVAFWLQIYSRHTTREMVLYDSRHPELVYEVLDFRKIHSSARSRLVYEVIVKNAVTRKLKAYREAFANLARKSKARRPSTPEEKSILSVVRKLPHRHDFSDLSRHLRTQTGQRDNIIRGLVAAETFFPKMELIFAEMKLPIELTRLSLVESSFTYSAVSRAGAVGVWQFMPGSGREYLTIDDKHGVDERLSPLKSTVAAGKLLKRNHRLLGNWALAITSYNHGLRRLRNLPKAEKFSAIAHVFDLCPKNQKSRHLGWASKNYYPEFLALLHAETYRDWIYGYVPHGTIRPLVFRKFGSAQDAVSFALHQGVTLQEFRLLNPDVRRLNRRLPKNYLLALPGDRDELAPLVAPPPRKKPVLMAKSGDPLSKGRPH